jgi:hypothetical protein
MRKWLSFIIILLVIGGFLFLDYKIGITGLFQTMSQEDLKTSIEIVDVKTKWVKKEYRVWPPMLKLAPAITFRVKNLTEEPLQYINFNAIFKFRGEREDFGSSFVAAIRKDPIPPGELSHEITMTCNYSVEGKNVADFKSNPGWKTVHVRMYAKSKGSQFAPVGEWNVSRDIDFVEEGPPNLPKKKEEKPEEKK